MPAPMALNVAVRVLCGLLFFCFSDAEQPVVMAAKQQVNAVVSSALRASEDAKGVTQLVDCGSWQGNHVEELHQQYYNIFKTQNRNAASHLWSSFLLDRAHCMTPENFKLMFSGFCAVSGSPVSPQDRTRYRLNLQVAGGGKRTGIMYYCCWPCVCDTQDFIKVDTKSVTLSDGSTQKLHFTVFGDPCKNPGELTKSFVDPFSGSSTTLHDEAPEVRCENGQLKGAHFSDHGHVILNMFFDEEVGSTSQDESIYAGHCADRAQQGYNSGMGEIFRRVAQITPVGTVTAIGA